MNRSPVLLVSCTRCSQLHTPHYDEAANPLCRRCTVPARTRAVRSRVRVRPPTAAR